MIIACWVRLSYLWCRLLRTLLQSMTSLRHGRAQRKGLWKIYPSCKRGNHLLNFQPNSSHLECCRSPTWTGSMVVPSYLELSPFEFPVDKSLRQGTHLKCTCSLWIVFGSPKDWALVGVVCNLWFWGRILKLFFHRCCAGGSRSQRLAAWSNCLEETWFPSSTCRFDRG